METDVKEPLTSLPWLQRKENNSKGLRQATTLNKKAAQMSISSQRLPTLFEFGSRMHTHYVWYNYDVTTSIAHENNFDFILT